MGGTGWWSRFGGRGAGSLRLPTSAHLDEHTLQRRAHLAVVVPKTIARLFHVVTLSREVLAHSHVVPDLKAPADIATVSGASVRRATDWRAGHRVGSLTALFTPIARALATESFYCMSTILEGTDSGQDDAVRNRMMTCKALLGLHLSSQDQHLML